MRGDNPIRKVVAANIKKYRKLLNMTQEKLAVKADISTTYVANIECGKTWVSDKTLEKISETLHVDIYQLFISDEKSDTNQQKQFNQVRKLIEKDRQAFHAFADSFCDKMLTDIHHTLG